jgi:hypothetical protein
VIREDIPSGNKADVLHRRRSIGAVQTLEGIPPRNDLEIATVRAREHEITTPEMLIQLEERQESS